MAQVTWTDRALDDLDAVCLFLARDAPRYAQLFAIQVFGAADRLAEFPGLGRVVPELGRNEIREVLVGRYRIIYRLLGDEVDILTLHHGVRPLESFDPPDTA